MTSLKLFGILTLRVDWWHLLAGASLGFILPIAPLIYITTGLVMADMITGVIAARRKDESIKSKSMFRTIEKMLVIYTIILVSEGVSLVFFKGTFSLTFVVTFIIAVSEYRSIIENAEVILGISLWKYLKEKFKIQ